MNTQEPLQQNRSVEHTESALEKSSRHALSSAVSFIERYSPLSMLVGSFAIVFLLYGRALEFSFLFDDTFDLTRTEGRSYISLLTASEDYSYYRPVPFLLWKASYQIFGHYDQQFLHFVPLVAHAVSGWLIYILIRRLGAGQWAIFPALLFLVYPFSYQNVAIVGVAFHPLAGMAILASLNLYLLGQTASGSRRVYFNFSALLFAVIALWSHESGVIVLPLLVGVELFEMWREGKRRPSAWLLPFVAATTLFLLLWFTVERTPVGETVTRSELRPKALFFLQGFTFPFSAQLRWIDDTLGISIGLLEAGLGAFLVVFGAYVVSIWRRGIRGWKIISVMAIPVAGVAIAVIAAMPAMVGLSWMYVEDSPRLLYLVGIGAAVFWGLLPALDFGDRRVTTLWRISTPILLLLIVLQSWRFIDVRIDMFESGTSAVNAVVMAGDAYAGQKLLIVNAPSWMAQNQYEYLFGHLGVQVMPSYIGLDRVIYTSSRQTAQVDVRSADVGADVSGGRFTFGPHGAALSPVELDALLREGRVVIEIVRSDDGFTALEGGHLQPGRAEIRSDGSGILDEQISISAVRTALHSDRFAIHLTWNVFRSLGVDSITVIEIRDAQGEAVRRYAGNALLGTSAPELWQPGDRVDDTIWFAALPSGEYRILAGIEGGQLFQSDIVEVGRLHIEH